LKIKGAAAYIDPLGFIGNQLESFTRQSCTFSDERSQSLTNQRIRWLQITNEFGITRGNYFRPLTNLKQTKKLEMNCNLLRDCSEPVLSLCLADVYLRE